jgi:hypothetical protein
MLLVAFTHAPVTRLLFTIAILVFISAAIALEFFHRRFVLRADKLRSRLSHCIAFLFSPPYSGIIPFSWIRGGF